MTKEELKEKFIESSNGINNTIKTYEDYLKIMESFLGETNPLIKKFYKVIKRFRYNNNYILDQLRYIIYNLPEDGNKKT